MSIGDLVPEAMAPSTETDARMVSAAFTAPDLIGWLEAATAKELDELPFGLIAMAADGIVEHYNTTEAKTAGLRPTRVIGRNFFTAVAPCTDNIMIAHRYRTEASFDVVIDYVFSFRLAVRTVRLRMMKRPGSRRMYLAVETQD